LFEPGSRARAAWIEHVDVAWSELSDVAVRQRDPLVVEATEHSRVGRQVRHAGRPAHDQRLASLHRVQAVAVMREDQPQREGSLKAWQHASQRNRGARPIRQVAVEEPDDDLALRFAPKVDSSVLELGSQGCVVLDGPSLNDGHASACVRLSVAAQGLLGVSRTDVPDCRRSRDGRVGEQLM
jgi:hypothetical protein